MKKISLLLLFGIMFLLNRVQAQTDVPVDLYSGQPVVNIPVYTITSGNVSVPVSLNYTAGVRADTRDGNDAYNLGVGWSLVAGGKITRTVRSLPDDYQGTGSDTRKGWIYGTEAANVNSFTPQSRTTCTQDGPNYSTINSLATSNQDAEPDMFSFGFGNYSGQFVFDNNKIIQTLPYQDLKITPGYTASGSISSFTVTTDNGVQYTFTPTTTLTVQVSPNGASNTVHYLKDKIDKYAQPMTYTTEWSLSSVTSVTGSTILITYGGTQANPAGYTVNLESTQTTPVYKDIYLANNTLGTILKHSLYTESITTDTKLISGIAGDMYSLGINYGADATYLYEFGGPNGSAQIPCYETFINSFQVYARGSSVQTTSLYYANTGRKFLQSIQTTNGCVKNPPYQFEYVGTDFSTLSSVLPNPYGPGGTQQCQMDYWGYYNANGATTLVPNLYAYPNESVQERYRLQQIPNYTGTYNYIAGGANRIPNPTVVTAGSLERITLPTGGAAIIAYESNQYYDAKANQNFYGGGVRVKSVTIHDGVNPANDIIKNYTYSGGLLINRPQYAFSVPVYEDAGGTTHTIDQYSDEPTQTEFFTARSEYDLNPYTTDGPNVVYQTVQEQQTGKGYSTYQFSAPATYGQVNSPEYAAPNQWQASYSRYATTINPSTSACMSQGMMTDGYYGFPFAPNPNYTFERGLLQSVKEYNESNQLVAEKDYQYTPVFQTTTPQLIYGLAYDYFIYNSTDVATRAYQYSKYQLFAGTNKFNSVEKITTYDPATNFAQALTTETDHQYASANHLLLTSSTTSTSNDGVNFTQYKVRYKYPQDYSNTTVSSPADAPTIALQTLKNAFIHNAVIEKISSMTKPGQAEQFTGAELHKYNTYNINSLTIPLPVQSAVLKTNVPLSFSNFTESSVNGSYAFVSDTKYQTTGNILEYNLAGSVASAQDQQHNLSGVHYDHTGKFATAVMKNASANQVVYSSFDYQNDGAPFQNDLTNTSINPYTFVLSSLTGVTKVTGRIGDAISVPATFTFSKTGINKGIGQNYLYSCWIQSGGTGTITVNLTDASSHSSSKQFTYTNTSGGWVYYKMLIPVSALNSSFNLQAVVSSAISIDDMLFYPAMAQVSLSSYAYLSNLLNTSTTDPHGNSTFYQYDDLRRLTLTSDNSQSILKRIIYNYNINYRLSAYFVCPTGVNVGTAVNFQIGTQDPCEPAGITRTWTFGDGATATGVSASHTYTTAGTYNVTLTVTSPQYGTVTSTQQITVFEQLAFDLTACGIATYNVCTNSVIAYCSSDANGPCGANFPVGTNTFTASNRINCSNNNDGMIWSMAYDNDPNNWISLSGTNSVTVNVANSNGSVSSNKSYTLKCVLFPTNCTAQSVTHTYHIWFVAPTCSN